MRNTLLRSERKFILMSTRYRRLNSDLRSSPSNTFVFFFISLRHWFQINILFGYEYQFEVGRAIFGWMIVVGTVYYLKHFSVATFS